MEVKTFYFRKEDINKQRIWDFFKDSLGEFVESTGAIVEIKPYKKVKTDQQRKYAHACIGIIAKEVGDNAQHLKIRIKHGLGLIDSIYSNGQVLSVERSTESLSREEYGIFIDAILGLASNLNINLPEPRIYGMEI